PADRRSSRLLTQDLVLRAQRPARQPRLVTSKQPESVQNLREQPRAGSDATPEVEHRCHGPAEPIQTLLQIGDPPAREVFLALSGDSERVRERRAVVRRVSIEGGHGPGGFLAYSRCPSRVTTMSYRRLSSSASAGK